MNFYGRPTSGVLLDENTSSGGDKYEADKRYFRAIEFAGGCPIGLPYTFDAIEFARRACNALMITGGRYTYPASWYVDRVPSDIQSSDRLAIELKAIETFLTDRRPVLGICAGMQSLACLSGCLITSDTESYHRTGSHNGMTVSHRVVIAPKTILNTIVGVCEMSVNSFHTEAIVHVAPSVVVNAVAADGVVEGIELDGKRFAIGVQWHAERHIETGHPGDRIFQAFVAACC